MNQIVEQERKKSDHGTDSGQSDDEKLKNEFQSKQKSSSIPSKHHLTSIKNLQTYFSYLFQQKHSPQCKEVSNQTITVQKDENIWKICALKNLQKIKSYHQDKQSKLNESINSQIGKCLSSTYIDPYLTILQKLLYASQKFISCKFSSQLIVHKFQRSKHSQIVTLDVQLLSFKTKICILNVPSKNPIKQQIKRFSSGSFGFVYFLKVLGQQMAIKLIPIDKNTQNFTQNINCFIKKISSAIQQYYFLVIFSQLEIGPKVKTIGGFDMVVYRDSIIFATQICETELNKQTIIEDLSESLMKMHTLRAVHRDIKPLNIMYSPQYKKNVFIDFGCTEAISQHLGQLTQTIFKGTPAFCMPEILNLNEKKKGRVDLYLNDAYALVKSINNLQTHENALKQDILYEIDNHYFQIIQLKYYLYQNDIANFQTLWNQIQTPNNKDFILIQTQFTKFLPEVQFYQITDFYQYHLSSNTESRQQLDEIAKVFQKKNIEIIYPLLVFPEKKKQFEFFESAYCIFGHQFSSNAPQYKYIKSILDNHQSTHQFIEKLKSDSKNGMFFDVAIKNIIQNSSDYLINNITLMCIICANYCSISKNNYGISFEKKIQAISYVLHILCKIKFINLEEFPFVFQNLVDHEMNLFGKFLQIYAIKVSQFIPYELKHSQLINFISCLCLIGYPIKNPQNVTQLAKGFISESQQQNKKYIKNDQSWCFMRREIMFFQLNLIYSFFSENTTMQYNLQDFNYSFPQDSSLRQIYKKTIQKIQIKGDNIKEEVQLLLGTIQNAQCLEKIIFNKLTQLNQDFVGKFLAGLHYLKDLHAKLLKNSKNQSSRWCSEFNQLWLLMMITISKMSKDFKLEGAKHFLHFHKNCFKPQFFQSNQLLYYYAFNYLFDSSLNDPDIQILDKADDIINCQKISIRFQIERRFSIAFNRRDYALIDKIIQILRQDFQQRSIHANLLKKMSLMVKNLWLLTAQYYKAKMPLTKFFISDLIYFYDVVCFFLKMGYRYAKEMPNFNEFYCIKIEKISEDEILKAYNKYVCNCDFYYCLSEIVELYCEMFPPVKFKTQHSEKIIKNHGFPEFYIDFKEEHLSFIKCLKEESIFFNYINKFIQFVKNNKQAKEIAKKSHIILLLLIDMHDTPTNKNGLTLQFHELIEQLFYDEKKGILGMAQQIPNFFILFKHVQKLICDSNFERKFCSEMIILFNEALSKSQHSIVYRQQSILYCLIDAFIICEKTYEEFVQLLRNLTKIFIYEKNENYTFELINYLEQFFQFPQVLQRQHLQKWNFNELQQFIDTSLRYIQYDKQPYMSLLYLENLMNKEVDDPIVKKLIIFIIRSFPYITENIRKYLGFRIHWHCYYAFYYEKKKKRIGKKQICLKASHLIKDSLLYLKIDSHRKWFYMFRKYHKQYFFHLDLTIYSFIQLMLYNFNCSDKQSISNRFLHLYMKKLERFISADGRYKKSQQIHSPDSRLKQIKRNITQSNLIFRQFNSDEAE